MAKSKPKTYNWDQLRAEFRLYPLSYAAFAREKGIADSTAYKHLRDLIDFKSPTTNDTTTKDEPLDFIPAELIDENELEVPEVTFIKTQPAPKQQSPHPNTPIEVKVGNFSIALTSGFDKNTFKDALEVLSELC